MLYSIRLIFFYLPYWSSIHKKANCIAIFGTRRPHSLGSCHFLAVRATCLPHRNGGVPLCALPKGKQANLFSTILPNSRAPSNKAVNIIFKVFWYVSTRRLISRSTDCEADALTTTPSRRLSKIRKCQERKSI